MSGLAVAQSRQFALYQPGDTLRICRPGETISLWEKAGSLLLFPANTLDFSGVATSLVTRIYSHFTHTNRIYVGDIVAASAREIAYRRGERATKFGDVAQTALRQSLEKAGLCHELCIAQWPPADLERLHSSLVTQLRVPKYFMSVKTYLDGTIRPSGM